MHNMHRNVVRLGVDPAHRLRICGFNVAVSMPHTLWDDSCLGGSFHASRVPPKLCHSKIICTRPHTEHKIPFDFNGLNFN